MIVIRSRSSHGRLARVCASLLCLMGLSALLPAEAGAQEVTSTTTIYACVGKSSLQVRIVPMTEVCNDTETQFVWNTVGLTGAKAKGDTGAMGRQGPVGETAPQGPPGSQSVAAATTTSVPATFVANNVCLNLGVVTITVPPLSPDGLLVATAKVSAKIAHTAGGAAFQDRGFAVFSLSGPLDCSAPDAYRSYYSFPAGWPGTGTGISATPLDVTLFVQAPYDLPAGGGTFVVYLNGQTLSGATATSVDVMQDPNIVVEYHPK
jgi:hypothetical protein